MITLLTDFGDSEYVGAMKGVIYSLNNEAKVVDLTHDIKPFDIRHAAYAIYSTFQYFPKATVHVVVVDPGVGTERKGLILELEGHFFVGPDNGVFSLIDAESTLEIKEKDASSTFHGRDIFAPIAADIDMGVSPKNFGVKRKRYLKVVKRDVKISDGIMGWVFCSDNFGNIITSIKGEHLRDFDLKIGDILNVRIDGKQVQAPLVRSYGFGKKEQFVGLINSSDHFEISTREGSVADRLKVQGGEKVEISL
jgi:S-adenosylmethionine hydrolase